jgi:hypothetical protein
MDKEIQQIGSYEDRLSMVVKYLDRKPEENVEGTESKKK